MTARPDRSRTERWCPVWHFAVTTSRKASRLTAENRDLTQSLAIVRADRDALASHLVLALRQRNTARDFSAHLMLAEPACDIGAEVEAFLRGEGPA